MPTYRVVWHAGRDLQPTMHALGCTDAARDVRRGGAEELFEAETWQRAAFLACRSAFPDPGEIPDDSITFTTKASAESWIEVKPCVR